MRRRNIKLATKDRTRDAERETKHPGNIISSVILWVKDKNLYVMM